MQSDRRHPFVEQYYGRFRGLLQWSDLDRLWQRLRERADAGWYVYTTGEPPPAAPADAATLRAFIARIDAALRAGHHEDYCGIVYVDDPDAPAFVKIFDPANLGMVCGSSNRPPLPGWILSLSAPVDLPQALASPAHHGWRRWLTTPGR